MKMNQIQPGWFSIPGAMHYTGFSEPSIRAASEAGKFPVHRVKITGNGRKENVRISRESLDAWIEGRVQTVNDLAPDAHGQDQLVVLYFPSVGKDEAFRPRLDRETTVRRIARRLGMDEDELVRATLLD